MRVAVALAVISGASMLPGAPAAAEDAYRFELTPFAAYGMGGGFDDAGSSRDFELDDADAAGLILNGQVEHNTQWEFLLGRQGTTLDSEPGLAGEPSLDVDIEYIHLGGTYLFDGSRVRPFIALTLGVTQFEPAPEGFDSERFFSASIGGGWQLNAVQRFGLRLEARAFTSFLDSDSELFCRSDAAGGACLVLVDSNTLTQWEVRAGLVFRF